MSLTHPYLRVAAIVIAAAGLILSVTVQAATVVFGSYTEPANAEARAAEVSDALGVNARLVKAAINDRIYLRVLGPQGLTTREAKDLLRRAHDNGFESAWYLDESDSNPTMEGVAEAPATASPPPAATSTPALDRTPAAAITAATAAASQPAPAAASIPPDPEGTTPGTAPERLLLTTTGISETSAVVVPRYEESAIVFKLDGKLDEPVWATIPGYDDMRVLEPDTLAMPRHKTLMRYFYTPKGLYVSMYAEQPQDTLLERLSSRDDFFSRDSVSITLDTSGSGIYGYWFSVALGDSLSDGKVAPERNYSREWDGPWDARTATTEAGWSAEMFLPWSMMAMPAADGERRIGLYVSRQVGYLDERFGYPHLPPTGARFMSALQPMSFSAVEPKRQLDLYPYVSGTHDFEAPESKGRVGMDIFWRPSTNLQMSATVNPDFGAVESDDVVVNLTATETYFPEKRLFFLEGNEVFETTPRSRPNLPGGRSAGSRRTISLFAPAPTQVVNTRRIGGSPDAIVPDDVEVPGYELAQPTDLLGALKATGQIGNVRYGAMGAMEDDMVLPGYDEDGNEVDVDTQGREFGVARLLYEDVGESRKSIGYIGTFTSTQTYDAIVHGVDAHYLNRSGRLQSDLQLLASDVDGENGYGALLDFKYTQRQGVIHVLQLDAEDDKLDINDLGFLRRNDNYGGNYSFNFTRSKGLERLRSYNFSFSSSYWQNGAGEATRIGTFFRNTFTFKNLFELRTEIDYFPKRWDDLESEGNGSYRIDDRWVFDVAFGTDTSKKLALSGRMGVRQEDLSGWSTLTSLGFTWKPNYRISMDLDLNYQDRDGWLLHYAGQQFTTFDADDWQPRLSMDLFLSARQQFRMSLQWAGIKSREQQRWFLPEDGNGDLIPVATDPDADDRDFVINRMTLQLRYRWQIAPLSDLYLVYTRGSNVEDNTLDDGFDDMFYDALTEPVIDFFVIKLRYRFGM